MSAALAGAVCLLGSELDLSCVCVLCAVFGTGVAERLGGRAGLLDLGTFFVIRLQESPWATVSGPYVYIFGLFLSELTFQASHQGHMVCLAGQWHLHACALHWVQAFWVCCIPTYI